MSLESVDELVTLSPGVDSWMKKRQTVQMTLSGLSCGIFFLLSSNQGRTELLSYFLLADSWRARSEPEPPLLHAGFHFSPMNVSSEDSPSFLF